MLFNIKDPVKYRLRFVLFLMLLFAANYAHAQFFQAGELDTGFNYGGIAHRHFAENGPLPGSGVDNTVYAMLRLADGRLLFGGSFDHYNGIPVNHLACFNAAGSQLDSTFDGGTKTNHEIYSIVQQNDGKILIGGTFTAYNGTTRYRIARLHTNGRIDSTFDAGTGINNIIYSIALQADSKVVIGGAFTVNNGLSRNHILRLHPDGRMDSSFQVGTGFNQIVRSVVVQPDGKLLVAGNFTAYNGIPCNRIARLNTNGSLDTSFNIGTAFNDQLYALAIQPDGKILAGGMFTNYNGTNINRLARLQANGQLDTTFNTGSGPTGYVYTIIVQPDGKIFLGGQFSFYNGTPHRRVIRLHPNGSRDSSFQVGTGGNNIVNALLPLPNGQLYVGGQFTEFNLLACTRLTRLLADGSNDFTFNPQSGPNNIVTNLKAHANGQLMLIGNFSRYNGLAYTDIVRLHADGGLDTTFNAMAGANGSIYTSALQPDGKLLIVGAFFSYNGINRGRIARLHPDGRLDTSFQTSLGANSTIADILLQADGKIIVGGAFSAYNGVPRERIARLNPDGSLDTSFNTSFSTSFNIGNLNNIIRTMALQPDGKLLIGGIFYYDNGVVRNKVIRLHSNGSLDTTFNATTNTEVRKIALLPNGGIVLGGAFNTVNGISRSGIARLHPNGTLDLGFTPAPGTNRDIKDLAVQPGGKVVIGGNFPTYNGSSYSYLARLNDDGTLDTTFKSQVGANDDVNSLAWLPNGKVVIGGDFTSYNGVNRPRIARVFAPDCITAVTNTTSPTSICAGDTKTLTGTPGGNWVIAHGPGSINGNTYTASAGGGTVSLYNLVGSCYSPLVSFTVDAPAAPTVSATVICVNGTATITPTAGGATYRFYADSITTTPLPGGNGVLSFTTPVLSSNTTYYVSSVSAAGCESSNRTAVTAMVFPLPIVNIVQLGDTLLATANSQVSFQWYRDELPIDGATSERFVPNRSGNYWVNCTSPQGCTASSNEIFVLFAGQQTLLNPAQWNSYPVPFTEQLTLEADAPFGYQLLDSHARVLLEGYTEKTWIQLPTEKLAAGIYLLKINIHGQTGIRKVVKSH